MACMSGYDRWMKSIMEVPLCSVTFTDPNTIFSNMSIENTSLADKNRLNVQPKANLCPEKIFINRSKDGQTVYTTVLWGDGEKTTVSCSIDKYVDEYTGFTAALAKRVYKTTGGAIKAMQKAQENTALPAKIKEAARKFNQEMKAKKAQEDRKALIQFRKHLENNAFEKLRAEKIAQERYDNMIAQQKAKDEDK